MATTKRTIVQAIDDLASELRTANMLRVLEAGATVIEHDDGKRATPSTVARIAYRNKLRAEVRAHLEIGGAS